MKRILLAALCLSLFIFTPAMTCMKGKNDTVFKSEKLSVDLAYTALNGFVAYYKAATNGAAPAKIAELNKQRDAVIKGSREVAVSVGTLEELRKEYEKNPASTNLLADIKNALKTVNEKSSNIVWAVNFYRNQN